jgi:diaminohydroxyphosphoribosylaminopyrimidine deaminase/5-amino-6-(5-phosphoribosylamino)uracil reductase
MPASTEQSARLLGAKNQPMDSFKPADSRFMRAALRLARRAYGETSPNPMVGAVLVKKNDIIGQGWHHRAGEPHAEIEALRDAEGHGNNPRGSTLYVTLEPCCSQGRTPPCTEAIIAAGIRRVVAACTDPNPAHSGRGFNLLKQAGIQVSHGILAEEAMRLNESFNHWIVHRQPLVTVKAAMTLDGKIATASGESKWITGAKARAWGMRMRQGADAILVGINTVLQDDPSLTIHAIEGERLKRWSSKMAPRLRRIVLDSKARVSLDAKVTSDAFVGLTTVVVTRAAPRQRVAALSKRVQVWIAPSQGGKVD